MEVEIQYDDLERAIDSIMDEIAEEVPRLSKKGYDRLRNKISGILSDSLPNYVEIEPPEHDDDY
jgi:hypothetical protein